MAWLSTADRAMINVLKTATSWKFQTFAVKRGDIKMPDKHSWREDWYNPNGVYEFSGVLTATCIQHFTCRKCGENIALPDGIHPLRRGCKNTKPAWKSPMRERCPHEEKRDYPAKPKKQSKRGGK